MYGPFFFGSLASSTAFKTSLCASAIDAVGKWSGKGPLISDQAVRQKCSLS